LRPFAAGAAQGFSEWSSKYVELQIFMPLPAIIR